MEVYGTNSQQAAFVSHVNRVRDISVKEIAKKSPISPTVLGVGVSLADARSIARCTPRLKGPSCKIVNSQL